jgi:hypothetical protein
VEARLVFFAGPEAEVTIRSEDDGYGLVVDCTDAAVAERVREALEIALSGDTGS